jgi:hypothetical protein
MNWKVRVPAWQRAPLKAKGVLQWLQNGIRIPAAFENHRILLSSSYAGIDSRSSRYKWLVTVAVASRHHRLIRRQRRRREEVLGHGLDNKKSNKSKIADKNTKKSTIVRKKWLEKIHQQE